MTGRNGRGTLDIEPHTAATAGEDIPAFLPAGRATRGDADQAEQAAPPASPPKAAPANRSSGRTDARTDARLGARPRASTASTAAAQQAVSREDDDDAAELREMALRKVEADALSYASALKRVEQKRVDLARAVGVAERRGVDGQQIDARLVVSGVSPAEVRDPES